MLEGREKALYISLQTSYPDIPVDVQSADWTIQRLLEPLWCLSYLKANSDFVPYSNQCGH